MLTRIKIRNFKTFSEAEIELGNAVVFIGPNNAGKTTALQALALWDLGLRRWTEKRKGPTPEKRPGVTINRRDLVALPVPGTKLMWRNKQLQSYHVDKQGKVRNPKIPIELIVEGVTDDVAWECGLEFTYANDESFYCRPLSLSNGERMPIPDEALQVKIAMLPPMSGLASNETRLDAGAIAVRIGEGRTAEVLRNLCYAAFESRSQNTHWDQLKSQMLRLFGISLDAPEYIRERGEVAMTYRAQDGIQLDLSASGRGQQQTLLLLAYLYTSPGAVLLLDEPDAHLEILRQREIYHVLTDLARQQNGQIVAASHSEILLEEAGDKDVVIAFVGKPHRINDRGTQLAKSLKSIRYEDYYLAETRGWVLYLEGTTDLVILQRFAELLKHPARASLNSPFFKSVCNRPSAAQDHFRGLREAKSDLRGVALFDNLKTDPSESGPLAITMWKRHEIENYFAFPSTLIAYAEAHGREVTPGPLFGTGEIDRHVRIMNTCLENFLPPFALKDENSDWWETEKLTPYLDRIFDKYFSELYLPNLMRKTNYHSLVEYTTSSSSHQEVAEKLDLIFTVSQIDASSNGGNSP